MTTHPHAFQWTYNDNAGTVRLLVFVDEYGAAELTWECDLERLRNGKGAPVTVDADKLDFSGLRVSDFPQGPGSTRPFTLPRWAGFHCPRYGDDEAESQRDGVRVDRKFDFDLKAWYGKFTRNVYTLALRVYVSARGTPYNLYFRGTVPIAP